MKKTKKLPHKNQQNGLELTVRNILFDLSKHGTSEREIAKMMGISQSSVNRIKNGNANFKFTNSIFSLVEQKKPSIKFTIEVIREL